MRKDNLALIVGASSDVAKQLAVLLCKQGVNLILTKRREDGELNLFANDLIIRYQTQIQVVELEATAYYDHESVLTPLLNKGVDTVYFFIGYLGNQFVAQSSWDECSRIITHNYTGPVSILNIVANYFERRKKGSIVAVSSVAGERGRQSNYFYGSAKSAFSAYLSGLRSRLFKSNIHVMTVLPGYMKTKMTAHLPLPSVLTATPVNAAECILRGIINQRNIIYVLPRWRFIMFIIVHIPEFLFKRLSI